MVRYINLPASYGEGIGGAGGNGAAEGLGRGVFIGEGGEQAGEKGITAADAANDGDGRRVGMIGTFCIEKDSPHRAQGDDDLFNAPFPQRGGSLPCVMDIVDRDAQDVPGFPPVNL